MLFWTFYVFHFSAKDERAEDEAEMPHNWESQQSHQIPGPCVTVSRSILKVGWLIVQVNDL